MESSGECCHDGWRQEIVDGIFHDAFHIITGLLARDWLVTVVASVIRQETETTMTTTRSFQIWRRNFQIISSNPPGWRTPNQSDKKSNQRIWRFLGFSLLFSLFGNICFISKRSTFIGLEIKRHPAQEPDAPGRREPSGPAAERDAAGPVRAMRPGAERDAAGRRERCGRAGESDAAGRVRGMRPGGWEGCGRAGEREAAGGRRAWAPRGRNRATVTMGNVPLGVIPSNWLDQHNNSAD